MNILAIINTFNLHDIPDHLYYCLRGWKDQKINANVDVVLSNNVPKVSLQSKLGGFFKNTNYKFYLADIHEHHPVYITFNATIKSLHKNYDIYVYCSEDCVMTNNTDLDVLVQEFSNDKVGIVSSLVNNDNSQWYPHYNSFDNTSSTVLLGESVNMHQFLFSKNFMEKYNFKYIDIFGAYATESLLTFLCAAVSLKWVHCQKVCLNHMRSGKTKGYDGHIMLDPKGYEAIFKTGQQFGLGFECCQGWYPFNQDLYNNGECLCKNDLYNYIKDNLFLSVENINYDKIINNMQLIEL